MSKLSPAQRAEMRARVAVCDIAISPLEQVALEAGRCVKCHHKSHRGDVCMHRVTDAAGSMDWCGCAWRAAAPAITLQKETILALLDALDEAERELEFIRTTAAYCAACQVQMEKDHP